MRALTGTNGHGGADPSSRAEGNVASRMFRTWLGIRLDARRCISLLLAVAGTGVATIGMAASPAPWAFGGDVAYAFGPVILGAGMGAYIRYRRSSDKRALRWAVAFGVFEAALLVAMFATAAAIRPTVLGMSRPSDAWYVLLLGGFAAMFVGALVWERDARRRRFQAVLFLLLWLVVGGVFASAGGARWSPLGPLTIVGGTGVMIVAFALSRPSPRQESSKPAASW